MRLSWQPFVFNANNIKETSRYFGVSSTLLVCDAV